MATEEYQVGYEAGYQDGFNAAQQPQARPDFADEWAGYLKDGETPFERFLRERKDLTALTKLYQRALEENESLKAQQPQAEPHKPLFADFIAQHPGLREELLEMDKQPQAEAVPPTNFDGVVPAAIRNYLRRCSSGGMPKKHIDIVQANVDEAERLGYFKLAIAEAVLAARAAPQQAEAVPPGYVLVPVEPTEAMLYPVKEDPPGSVLGDMGAKYRKVVWSSMLDAAIAQQKGQP